MRKQKTEQNLTNDCGEKVDNVNKQNSEVEDIDVIEILCRMEKQMSCPRKLFYVCVTIALVTFFCLEEKMDYFRQYDDAVRAFVGWNVYGVLTPLLAMLFGALALMVTFGTNSSKFRSQQGKEKKVPLMKGIANFVVSDIITYIGIDFRFDFLHYRLYLVRILGHRIYPICFAEHFRHCFYFVCK